MLGWILPLVSRFALVIAGLSLVAPALATDQEELAARRDGKRDSDFFYRSAWEVDYRHAVARARYWKVPLLAYFTRSDEPIPECVALEDGVLVADDFVELGEKLSLYCNILSGVDTDPHQGMFFEKNGEEWPHVVVLDAEGRLLVAHDGEHTTAGYRATLERAKGIAAEIDALEERSGKGDAEATLALLEARLELGHLSADVGRERLDALPGLDEKGRSRVKALIDRRAYAEVFSAYLLKRSSAKESMARYRGLQESGAAPRVSQAVTFWRLVAEDALARKDTPMASLAVEGLAGLIGGAENTSSIEKAVDALRQRVLGGN